ncbi:putative protein gravitropic in the light 1 [Helianthus annuus]|nr:putative protein gravitropic in the light 1 [Helianthus annuus]
MSEKLDEMDRFASGTNSILNEMRQRVEDLVEETSRQRQRAAENEQELTRVKQDFESLKSYVSSLVGVRETLVSSEKQFQTIEKLFERLVCKLEMGAIKCTPTYYFLYPLPIKSHLNLSYLPPKKSYFFKVFFFVTKQVQKCKNIL